MSVFLALSRPADVTVTVFSGRPQSGQGPRAGSGTAHTRPMGAHLHAVVGTVVPDVSLALRSCFSYDVVVDDGSGAKGPRRWACSRTRPGHRETRGR